MTNTPTEPIQGTVDGQQTHDGQSYPAVLECNAATDLPSTLAWVVRERAAVDSLLKGTGTVLFRGFPLQSIDDFDGLVRAFDMPNFAYNESLSNAVRVNWTDRVFSANEAPPDVPIYLHHEMAQTPIYPSMLFFYCQKAAEEGGATPLCRSDVLVERLERECPNFLRDCSEKGLKYSNVMPAENDPESGMGRSWKSTLRAESRDDAEARLLKLSYSWEWLDDDCLRVTTPVLPAVRELENGQRSFFNQLIAAFRGWKDSRNSSSKAIRHGDDSPLDIDGVMRAVEIAEELTFDLPWQAGDVVLLDNYRVMHGRRFFVGTRKVLASLVAAE
ncbi:MAG TPA: SyrP protein [Planctomycetaceae bacterium]|nr:SyrP protein [Planctomycetaceae bacterium]